MEAYALRGKRVASILAVEYFLGGGSARVTGPLLLEGYAMLKAICEALTRVGCRVVVPVDERLLPYVDLRASELVPAKPGSLFELIVEGLEADLALTIAPPVSGAHAALVRVLEEAGLKHLGSPSWKIEKYSDKLRQMEALSRRGLPTPRTEAIDDPSTSSLRALLSSISPPLVLKPRLGAGCEGMLVVEGVEDLEEALAAGLVGEGYLAQEALRGVHASAPVFSDGDEAWAPCLNAQLIEWGRRPSYEGGLTPLDHPVAERALRVAEEAVRALGLEGYVGVDLVLTGAEAYVVEVNPRPTTSVVSLLEVLGRGSLGSLLVSTALRSLSRLVKPGVRGRLTWAFAKAKSLSERLYLSPDLRRTLLDAGAYAVVPAIGWIGAGEPVAIVKSMGLGAEDALSNVKRLRAEVEGLASSYTQGPHC